MKPPDPAGAPPPLRSARAVPADHALAWYREAMTLFRKGPVAFALLALATVLVELALQVVPVAGAALAQVVVPLVACGLIFASLAADRGEKPRVAHVALVLGAAPRALAAVVLAGLAVFAAQATTAWLVAGVDLLDPSKGIELPTSALPAVYAVGVIASLPVTFVPFAALFDGAGVSDAFVLSLQGFARNLAPLFLYGLVSLALLLIGVLTAGLGLLLALPLISIASYVAWKDVYAVGRG